jgi:hypothetical protein
VNPDPVDLQNKREDIGQAIAASAGSLAYYETVEKDEGIENDKGKYEIQEKLEILDSGVFLNERYLCCIPHRVETWGA